jgi:hypothetical protein
MASTCNHSFASTCQERSKARAGLPKTDGSNLKSLFINILSMNSFNQAREDSFNEEWTECIQDLVNRKILVLNLYASLESNYQDVLRLQDLVVKILRNKNLIPADVPQKDKLSIIHYHVRNYSACILMSLDDVLFGQNGRIMNDVRREDVPKAHISKRKNWHHAEFDSTDDVPKTDVSLSINCVDALVKLQKKMKKRFQSEFQDFEVSCSYIYLFTIESYTIYLCYRMTKS